jgi:glucose-6-phosphate dehydrogenase assembly protein OpcA
MSTTIHSAKPEAILKELGKLWTSLGEEESKNGKPTVLRACAMTLLVATDDDDTELFAASQTLVDLMQTHPSRAIVLRSTPNAEQGLASRVLAQCWKPFGKAQQICCEQIEVEASPARWPNIGPTVLGLTVPDLPVVVWCRQKSALTPHGENSAHAGLDAVLELATKVIVDTRGLDLTGAFEVMEEWETPGRSVADLEWSRITPWREAIAGAFEDPHLLSQREHFTSVEITSGDSVPPASALYLAAWLQKGVPAKPQFVQGGKYGSGLQKVRLLGDDAQVELELVGPQCLALRVGGKSQNLSLQTSSLYGLMHEELTILGQDDEFRAAFTRAKALLGGK